MTHLAGMDAVRAVVASSGQELESFRMPRPDDAEIAPVQGRDLRDAEAFGCGDHRGIDAAEG
jgi:hypothetical protein